MALNNGVNPLPTPGDTPTSMDLQDGVDASPLTYANHSTTWTPVDSMTPISTNPSRKRSRDETAFDAVDAENSYFPPLSQQVNAPEPIPEEPIYGEGMVLLNPQTGHALSAESQTGTWYEEKAEEEDVRKQWDMPAEPANRPQMPLARKTMRLSQSSIRATIEQTNGANASAPASPPKSAAHPPEVDEATLALGIGWTQMSSEDPDLQAAARGWARYLENHYSRYIHDAEILLKNRGLDAYLVGCREGFFLFTEDLLRGQLVGRTWDATLNNLRSQPMQFDGNEVLTAERTPGPETVATANEDKKVVNDWKDWNSLQQQNGNALTTGQSAATTNGVGGMDLD